MHFTNLFTVLFIIVYYGRRLLYKKVMTKIKWFQLRLFRTIRHQICSIDMIDIETFTNIFRLLNHVDRSIIEKYIQGYSIKSIADEFEYSKAFVSERIYVFRNELKKEISKNRVKLRIKINLSYFFLIKFIKSVLKPFLIDLRPRK